MTTNAVALLSVENVGMQFGGLTALEAVSFSLNEKKIVAVIGPNGAGKTTLFNCLSGFYQPTTGRVMLDGRAIDKLPSHEIARAGLVRTFQNIRLFKQMTVMENLLVAQFTRSDNRLWAGLLNNRHYREKEETVKREAIYWLERMELTPFANREAGNLAYGQQRRLEIARCMATAPRLLLLDEPAAGLNPNETVALCQLISDLRNDHGVTILLIEHDMSLVMEISEEILVLDRGRPIAWGVPAAIREDRAVISAYLGEECL
ncbi:MAG: high-affinity branched-chain amino acid ABC transporter ATP-binding protein LivG [Gammaproteobacteria bacterium]|nr:high-affinity branched-chain amino acid ABC transporter ATP-binding protein LivG [Gammaproteobacteria bacterium]